MRERSDATLLDFAIAASVAIAPMLLAVLVAIGEFLPSDRETAPADAHVSARRLAALKTFEHAIVRRDDANHMDIDARAVVAALPECQREWRGGSRAFDRFRAWIGRGASERPAAERIAVELVAIDDALARMSAEANRRVAERVAFDLDRWANAAREALGAPVESAQYPGRRFTVACGDLAAAVGAMARGGGRMLATLAWRGTEVERRVAGWRPDQVVEISPRLIARVNPWAGVPGCVYVGVGASEVPAAYVASVRAASDRVCSQPAVYATAVDETMTERPVRIAGEPRADDPPSDARWQVPPGLFALLQPLEPLLRPSGLLHRHYAQGRNANRVALHGVEVDVGFSVDLTIDPSLQALAQRMAACYTGRQDVCAALGVHRAEDRDGVVGHRLLERAAVRMAAIAIVDVPTGRIDALAGAMSACTRQEYDGPGRATACDARLPYPIRYRPDALRNAAVHHDAMPASVVKPIMAASFLANASVGARWLAAERASMRTPGVPAAQSLRGQLMRSDSARFLDRMFCADQGFRPCERVWEIEAVAASFGWNAGCETASERCGRRDLLFGRAMAVDDDATQPVASWIPYGRLLVAPGARASAGVFVNRAPIALDTQRIRRCAAGRDRHPGSRDDWEKCSGGVVVDVVAEGWGQGHARATALGAAGMMAALAAAANGETIVRKPHLVRAIRGIASETPVPIEADSTRWGEAAAERNAISRDAAEVILSGLSYSHRNGTARAACEQVFDARACRDIDWIAGKTGTPTFPNDDRSLDELARLCAAGVARNAADELACSSLRPYKWYVAAYRSDPRSPLWNKAIGVLAERNWLADSGRVHGAGDHGPNPAAEIALQIAGRHVGVLGTDVR